MSLPPFVTIPRPINRGRDGERKAGSDYERIHTGKLQVYLAPGEKELAKRTAKLCGTSVSELIRQLIVNTATALEVRNGNRDRS